MVRDVLADYNWRGVSRMGGGAIMKWQAYAVFEASTALSIPLTQGQFAIIDATDLPIVKRHKWQVIRRSDGNGFYACNSSGYRMHRMLLGVWDHRIVDHRDGDGLNNRRNNIRVGTQSLNSVNRMRAE